MVSFDRPHMTYYQSAIHLRDKMRYWPKIAIFSTNAMQARPIPSCGVCPSVCVCVCHIRTLFQNE